MEVRRARRDESDAIAAVMRASRTAAMPYLPDLHTAEEDRAFVRERVFAACEVWVATDEGGIAGFCAARAAWIDHLYVRPDRQRIGIGSALLRRALEGATLVQLWTFQRNANARRFYENRGFVCVRTTHGDNEEGEPDALYVWTSGGSPKE